MGKKISRDNAPQEAELVSTLEQEEGNEELQKPDPSKKEKENSSSTQPKELQVKESSPLISSKPPKSPVVEKKKKKREGKSKERKKTQEFKNSDLEAFRQDFAKKQGVKEVFNYE